MRTGLNAATTPFGVEDVCDLNQVALDKRREVYDSANAKGDVLSGLQGAETVCGITTSQSTNETLEDSKGMKIRSYKEPLGVVAAVFPFTPHELTAMISFLGGYRAGEYVYTHGCATGKRVQANLGVMNHAAVLFNANRLSMP
ncbi:aldehyde dehydrogenase (NADP(+)) ald6 [Aspergillus fumigatus]